MTISKFARVAMIAMIPVFAVGCKTITLDDGTTKQVLDVAKVKRGADIVVPILRSSALQAAAMPGFDDAKKADLDKAMKSLDAAYTSIKSMPDDATNAGYLIGAFAGAAQTVIPMLPLKPEQQIAVSTGLALVQVGAPFIGEIRKAN